jgi:hypothetical protein
VGIVSNEVKYYPPKILAKNIAFLGGKVKAINLSAKKAKKKRNKKRHDPLVDDVSEVNAT